MRRLLPRAIANWIIGIVLRLNTGKWETYGLQMPQSRLHEMHPTINGVFLGALRDGRVLPRPGIARFEGQNVHFVDGTVEPFDTVIWATGFRIGFPFLDSSVVDWDMSKRPPLYLSMMHKRLPNLFFVGLFQPLGCIWRLADRQARIAALQIAGRLARPADLAIRIANAVPHGRFAKTPRHAIEVDYHLFARELAEEIENARPPQFGRASTGLFRHNADNADSFELSR